MFFSGSDTTVKAKTTTTTTTTPRPSEQKDLPHASHAFGLKESCYAQFCHKEPHIASLPRVFLK